MSQQKQNVSPQENENEYEFMRIRDYVKSDCLGLDFESYHFSGACKNLQKFDP